MDMIITWILFGTMIGLLSTLFDMVPTVDKMLMSVVYGIVGAIGGGLLGEFMLSSPASFGYISPLLYMIIGSVILVMLPKENRLF